MKKNTKMMWIVETKYNRTMVFRHKISAKVFASVVKGYEISAGGYVKLHEVKIIKTLNLLSKALKK